jgi:hypothetical protein
LHQRITKNRDGQYILKANNPDYENLPATDDMRTLARLRNIIDPLDLAIGETFAQVHGPLDRWQPLSLAKPKRH